MTVLCVNLHIQRTFVLVLRAVACDLIEILFVSHWSYNINNLVERYVWVLGQVGISLVSQDSIVANFLKLDRWQVHLLQVFTQKDLVEHFY